MSSSSSSDSDAMAVDVSKTQDKTKSKTKTAAKRPSKADTKHKSRATIDSEDDASSSEEEGVDYRPPKGFNPLNVEVDAEFDWDAVSADPNTELWLIRVPEGFKSKQLDGLSLRHGRGTISRKTGTATHLVAPAEDQADEQTSLRCLLPRKRKSGKFFLAPKPISQHLVVTQVPATPTVDLTLRTDERPRAKRPEWPAAMLKGRFEPCGVKGVQAAAMEDSSIAVDDMDEGDDEPPAKKKAKVDSDQVDSSKKKEKHQKNADDDDDDDERKAKEKKKKDREEKKEKKRKAAEAAEAADTPGSTKKSKKVKIA